MCIIKEVKKINLHELVLREVDLDPMQTTWFSSQTLLVMLEDQSRMFSKIISLHKEST